VSRYERGVNDCRVKLAPPVNVDVPKKYVDHYNAHRPHRSLDQASPLSVLLPVTPTSCPDIQHLRRSGRLGGLIHESKLAA